MDTTNNRRYGFRTSTTLSINTVVQGDVGEGRTPQSYLKNLVDDSFVMPKCVGVIDVSSTLDVRFPVYVDPDDKELLDKIRNRTVFEFDDTARIRDVLLKNPGKVLSIPVFAHSRIEYPGHRTMNGDFLSIRIQSVIDLFMSFCGVRHDSDGDLTKFRTGKDVYDPHDYRWRRFALAYRVLGDGFASAEFGHAADGYGSNGLDLYCSFLRPRNANTFVRLYIYDLSSLSLDNFAVSAVVGNEYKHGIRVMKHEIADEFKEMFDTTFKEDFGKKQVESFHSSAYYLRIIGSTNLKKGRTQRIYNEYGEVSPAGRTYGLMTGSSTQYRGVESLKYSGLGFNTQYAAAFVPTFVNEYKENARQNSHGSDYEAGFYMATPKNEADSIYLTSRTIHYENGGLIIQQMPDHIFFADVKQIDDKLKRIGYDPNNPVGPDI